MSLTRRSFIASACATPLFAPAVFGQSNMQITQIAGGFDAPWAIGFAGNGVLVTERDGALIYLSGTTRRTVSGLPEIAANGQGGLLDILIPRNHAQSQLIFMTYAKPQGRREGTAILRARFDPERAALTEVTSIFEMRRGSSGGRHFGSRLVEGPDGTLFASIGDRGDREQAQNTETHNGTIVRVTKTGAVPSDNPFVGRLGHLPEIWSYGHRNPQGMTLDLKGNLWAHEHGAKGGDEINKIEKGANYGWPVISYGTHYSGAKIGIGTAQEGMQQPAHFWDPSIAPSGYMIYSGKLWKEWRGHHFVGSLKFDYISRLTGSPLKEVAQIKSDATARVRDIREAADGSIWFLSVGNDGLYRMSPS
ncbi:PQQ-dependent sugar dehydrogenase [Planktotalea sp.]|uniref:PQQ-dependent sugar dehydrogenase n=1 Tax=Planktotalea sp. TaxID=2029877 RepID=UPI00329A6B43